MSPPSRKASDSGTQVPLLTQAHRAMGVAELEDALAVVRDKAARIRETRVTATDAAHTLGEGIVVAKGAVPDDLDAQILTARREDDDAGVVLAGLSHIADPGQLERTDLSEGG